MAHYHNDNNSHIDNQLGDGLCDCGGRGRGAIMSSSLLGCFFLHNKDGERIEGETDAAFEQEGGAGLL